MTRTKALTVAMAAALILTTGGIVLAAGRPSDQDQQFELRNRAIELEARELELEFQRELRKLELDERRVAIKQRAKEHDNGGGFLVLVLVVVHILLTVWVFQDLRKRNDGSGIWIAITLLTGILGALLYAVVRLGDTRKDSASE